MNHMKIYLCGLLSISMLLTINESSCTRRKKRSAQQQELVQAVKNKPSIITQLIPSPRTLLTLAALGSCVIAQGMECYGGGTMQLNQEWLSSLPEDSYGPFSETTPMPFLAMLELFQTNPNTHSNPLFACMYNSWIEDTQALECPLDTKIIARKSPNRPLPRPVTFQRSALLRADD